MYPPNFKQGRMFNLHGQELEILIQYLTKEANRLSSTNDI